MQTKEEFLQGCLTGWHDSMKEDPDWVNKTKSERKTLAKDALIEFDKIYFALQMADSYRNLYSETI